MKITIRIDEVFATPLTPAEETEQMKYERFSTFNQIWASLKIGYDPISKATFRVKNGSELGESFDTNTFYNSETLQEAVGHIYACNEQRMTDLANQCNVLSILGADTWIEPWGSFETNLIEIKAVMLKAGEIKKEVYNQIFGV